MGAQPAGSGSGQFPVTRWTLIAAARSDPAAQRAALEELLGLYWTPLYSFARRKGLDVEAAQDAVQGLIARLLERDFLARIDPARGRFRAYLRTALANHLANEHERATAQKRGGPLAPTPLDFDLAERRLAAAPVHPEQAFEREWALGVLERALARLRAEFEDGRRQGPFALVTAFFGTGATPPSYAEAIASGDADISDTRFNLFFFGDFVRMDYAAFHDAMEAVMSDPSRTYEMQVREVYTLGRFLAERKYRYLRLAYLAFISGLVLSAAVIVVERFS